MMPPTPGGPATHAKKLQEHFEGGGSAAAQSTLFNFEKYKKYPSGIRHLLTFLTFIFSPKFSFSKYDIIFVLDGFTVALPAVLAGVILRKKVILRIGGDFIYENFLYTKETDYESFYKNFQENKKKFGWKLYFKYLIQKFVIQNSHGIIFNTEWQKEIFINHYKLKNKLWVIQNPIEEIPENIYESISYVNPNNLNPKYIFTSITRDIPYKNQARVKRAIHQALKENGEIFFEYTQGSWESCLKRISISRAYICCSISDISPNQVLEALSLKIPVIMTKYCGLSDDLKNSGVCILVDPFNETEIQQAILTMCDENKYVEFKKNFKTFKWPENWQTLFEKYERIINDTL